MKETREERYLRIGTERLRLVLQARELIALADTLGQRWYWREVCAHMDPPRGRWQSIRKWVLMTTSVPTAELTPQHFFPRTHLCGRKPKPAQP